MVVNTISRLYMKNITRVHDEFVKDVHRLTRLRVCPMNFNDSSVIVQNSFESSLMIEAK